jgi:hypothetical protein
MAFTVSQFISKPDKPVHYPGNCQDYKNICTVHISPFVKADEATIRVALSAFVVSV